jgi:hypothetical protein
MTTRTRNPTTALEYVLTNLLTDEVYRGVFTAAGITTITDFLVMGRDDFALNMAGLNLTQQKRCLQVQQWFRENGNNDVNQWFLLTSDMFEIWRLQSNEQEANIVQPTATTVSTTVSRLQRSVKLSVDDYHELKEAKFWL